MNTMTIKRPDDWHIHLRDGIALERTVQDVAQTFQRAVVMPNLVPPIKTVRNALNYRATITSFTPAGSPFEPLMTLYLTDETEAMDLLQAKQQGVVACKLYPQGATTNSEFGVKNIESLYPILQVMSEQGLLLLLHGEITDPNTDIFDREKKFIDTILTKLLQDFPNLKIVLEHITTEHAVKFVKEASPQLAATITAHHLWLNRNDLLSGGIKPHHYCLPVVKRESDRLALIKAATSGNPKFFLGTDSAPHAQSKKESSCGCAGIYTAYHALPLYAEIFEIQGALDKLEGFASEFGADFYGFSHNQETVTLVRAPWVVPNELSFLEDGPVIPFLAGQTLQWRLL
ncbi:MAG: dihydroorotase [Gammaproteobacteria bacterium]